MSSKRQRRRRGNHSDEALAMAAFVGILAASQQPRLTNYDDDAVSIEGTRLAARLFTASTDDEREQRVLEAVERGGADSITATLAHALVQLAGGYLPALLLRINELEGVTPEPTEVMLHMQAAQIIHNIDQGASK